MEVIFILTAVLITLSYCFVNAKH